MSNLDDKLKEIYQSRSYYEESEWVAKVKQAFADEGWQSPEQLHITHGAVEAARRHGIFNGQEWYDRFLKELPSRLVNDVDCIRAAKKATGL